MIRSLATTGGTVFYLTERTLHVFSRRYKCSLLLAKENMQKNTTPAKPESDWGALYKKYECEPDESAFWDRVISQQVEEGDALDEPSKPVRELIDQLSEENFDVDLTPAWTAARNRFLGAKPQAVKSPPQTSERWNDAALTGDDCPAWATLLDMPVHVTMGRQFTDTAKKRQSTKDDKWNGAEITWRGLIEGDAGQAAAFQSNRREAWGLSRHAVGQKDGSGFVLGNCNTQRRAASVTSVPALGIDADTGDFTFEEACDRARAHDVAFIGYTTHSHLSTTLRFKRDAVIDHAGCDSDPTLDQVKAFAAEKKKLAPHIVDSIEIEDLCEETPDGWMIKVETAPIPKFRMIFPLAEGDVRLATLANKQKDAQAVVAAKIRGLSDMLGIPTDPATLDVSRFFFGPRHARGAKHCTVIHRAPPISFADIPAIENAKTSNGGHSRRPDVFTKDKLNVSELYRQYGKRYELARMSEDADLGTSATADNSSGKFHVVCPFADGHTDSSDDGATCAWDADPDGDGAAQFARISCRHGSCQHRRTDDFLSAWIDNGDLDPAWLEDPAYMIPFADGQDEEKFFRKTPEETKGEAEARAFLRDRLETIDGETRLPDDADDACAAMLEDMGIDPATARTRAAEAMEDVQRQIDDRARDRQSDPAADARREARGDAPIPHVLAPLHDDKLVDADGFMVTPEDAPEIYRAYGIKPNAKNAEKLMQLEIRDQIYRSLDERFSYIVLDGESKLAIAQEPGQPIRLWKDATMGKLYLNRAVSYTTTDANGKSKVQQIKPAEIFMFARQRATFFDTCFEPDPAKAKDAARRGAYNLWNGYAVDPAPGDWSLLRNHIKDNLCHGDDKHFAWFMTWLASIFARPGVKVPSSLAIIGEQGTGKSKVLDWVRRAVGASALKVSAMRHLTGNFNAHLDGLILLVCEEAFWAGNKAEGGVIKDLISSETLQIEGKFQNVVERPNYVNIVFISNNKWSVPVDGEDARRFFVLEASTAQKKNSAYFGAIDDQMENGGLEAMIHELMNWDPACIGGWNNLRYPPVTDSLRQQAGMGLSGPTARLVDGLEAGIISGRTPDGDQFYYVLNDKEPTDVTRLHLVCFMNADGGRGNLTQEMKDAIVAILGAGADHGDEKKRIEYAGGWNRDALEREKRVTSDRERYVTVPALNDVKEVLARYGRG